MSEQVVAAISIGGDGHYKLCVDGDQAAYAATTGGSVERAVTISRHDAERLQRAIDAYEDAYSELSKLFESAAKDYPPTTIGGDFL